MTTDGDTAPGAGDDAGPGRRRVHVDHVTDELASLRRDVSQQGGLLAELAPRVEDLDGEMTEVRAFVRRLIEEADEQAVEDQAETEARRAAGLLDEPAAPWTWPILDRPTAQAAWAALDRWCASVLVGQYQLELRRLPSCWPAHPAAVAELTALRASHVAAHDKRAHPGAALTWARELPAALDRIAVAVPADRCPPGLHLLDPNHEPPSQRERERVGGQALSPEMWRQMLEDVVRDDVSWRREPPPKAS